MDRYTVSTLLLLIGVVAAAAEVPSIDDVRVINEDVISFTSPFSAGGLEEWTTFGSAVMDERWIKLTTGYQSQRGGLWSTHEILNSGANWQIEVEFQITGNMGKLFGDGVAVWFTKDKLQVGDTFGNNPQWVGMGVFVDTYDNSDRTTMSMNRHQHPYVYAFVNDGHSTYNHNEHVNGGCHAPVRPSRGVGPITKLRITYRDHGLHVAVAIDSDKGGQYSNCLYIDNITLPPGYYVGITSSTGDLVDTHAVSSFLMREIMPSRTDDRTKLALDAAETAKRQMIERREAEKKAVEEVPSDDEMQGINRIIEATDVVKVIKGMVDNHHKEILELKTHLSRTHSTMSEHLKSMIAKIQRHEEEIDRRVEILENRYQAKYNFATEQAELARGAWIYPFLVVFIVVILIALFLYSRYRKVLKTHLL